MNVPATFADDPPIECLAHPRRESCAISARMGTFPPRNMVDSGPKTPFWTSPSRFWQLTIKPLMLNEPWGRRQVDDRWAADGILEWFSVRAQVGYKRRPGSYGGKPSLAADNTLDRPFDVAAPVRAWVTDIASICTLVGFACLAVVIDLYSRRDLGWSMHSRQTTDAALQAPHTAVWRRKPKQRVDPLRRIHPVSRAGRLDFKLLWRGFEQPSSMAAAR